MRTTALTALAVLAALSLTASLASADSGLSVDDTDATLTFRSLTFSGGLGVDIVCSVTLDVSLHEGVAKTAGALAGFADVAVGTDSCSEGRIGLLSGRSRVTEARGYHVTYSSFTGTLPNIDAVSLVVNDVTFWIEYEGGSVQCLTSGAEDILGTTTGGNPATGANVSAAGVDLTGGFLCSFSSGSMSAEGTLDEAVGIELI